MRWLFAVLLVGCVASPKEIFLEPGTQLDDEDSHLVADIVMGTYADYRELNNSPEITDEQMDAIHAIPIYVVGCESCEELYNRGKDAELAQFRITPVRGRDIPNIVIYDFISREQHLRNNLPHEYGHVIDWIVRKQKQDPDHEDWLMWDAVVPEARIRVKNALEN